MVGVDFTHSNNCTDDHDVLDGYLPALIQHLQDTRARLGTGVGSQVDEGASGTVTSAQASSDWTPVERDAFFRALSVYSRWRPDLIAACVPTKSEWEVWKYLDALEEGATMLAMQEDEDVEMMVDGDADADAGNLWRSVVRADEDMELAVEVSQAWIDVEERMALWITEEEHRVAVEADDVAGAEGMPRRRKRLRGLAKARAQSQQVWAVVDEDRSPSADPFTRERSQEPSEKKRQAFMSHLEIPHLLVLDGILRGGDEANKDTSQSREGSAAATRTECGDEGEPYVEEPNSSTQIIAPRETSDISRVTIDPVLLALSGDANPIERHSEGASYVPVQDTCLLDQPSQPGGTTTFTFPLGAATHDHPNPAANTEPDLSLFSPQSRRRIQKRLYMRRKRANGKGVVDTGIGKLKPGKKAESERKGTPAVSTSLPSDTEEEVTENRKNKGGLRLPYRLKAQFAELGIDAAYLGNKGMDLLNMAALSRLMRRWTFPEQGKETGRSVDAELIRHLQASTVLFVTDIIHRAIVWREREIRLKQRSQAWRQGDHITVAAIEHAVAAVGAHYYSDKKHFESLSCSEAPDDPMAPSVDGDGEAADLSPGVPRLSPYRDVYTPLIRPPSEWRIGALSCLARTYEREATRTRRGPSAEHEDELMSDETDEEALAAELAEDAAVDEGDLAHSEGVEAGLFDKIRFNFI